MTWRKWKRTVHSYQHNLPNILSQLFVNLAAAWFGLLVVTPGFYGINSINSFAELIKNLLFGILAISIATVISKDK
jgi:hypothetical protein